MLSEHEFTKQCDATFEALRNRLGMSVGTFQTVLGSVSFKKNGDPFQPNMYYYKVTSGALKFDSAQIPNPLIISR